MTGGTFGTLLMEEGPGPGPGRPEFSFGRWQRKSSRLEAFSLNGSRPRFWPARPKSSRTWEHQNATDGRTFFVQFRDARGGPKGVSLMMTGRGALPCFRLAGVAAARFLRRDLVSGGRRGGGSGQRMFRPAGNGFGNGRRPAQLGRRRKPRGRRFSAISNVEFPARTECAANFFSKIYFHEPEGPFLLCPPPRNGLPLGSDGPGCVAQAGLQAPSALEIIFLRR